MKKVLKFKLMLFMSVSVNSISFAQTNPPGTRATARNLQVQVNPIIKDELRNVGEVAFVRIEVAKITKIPTRDKSIFGIRLSNEKVYTMVNIDEIDNLVNALRFIIQNVYTSYPPPEISTSYSLILKNGCKIFIYYDFTQKSWKTFIQVNYNDVKSISYCSQEELEKFLNFIIVAKKVIVDANK